MTSCACPAASLTSLRFADGLVMLRCAAHEQQAWFVDGRAAERHEVLPALRDLFVDRRRGERSAGRVRPARPRVLQMQEPAPHEVVPVEADDSERLTALLRARGLSGSWAVA
ncbi:MAG: hypothetical protein JWM62_1294 [Frankiales bacterium]|nr:hypothetical protein [Frankiales bacterium]